MAELVEALPFFFIGRMTFWTYMLQCADLSFYVGQTDDLEARLRQHQAGKFKGYTATRRPVHLVWAADFPTRDEAGLFALRLKGWRRDKKLALIRGDWAAISALGHTSKEEGWALSGSATPAFGTERGVLLHPHPALLPSEPFSLRVMLSATDTVARLRFTLTGAISALSIADPAPPCRRDGLWQHTCFEMFASGADGYVEVNLSPSTEWAAYRFAGYREGMADLDIPPPVIAVTRTDHYLILTAELRLPTPPIRVGMAAVIEEGSGRKSYWALRHPPGDRPDFHHPDCFALDLSSAGEP